MMTEQMDIKGTCCKQTCCADGCCSDGCKTESAVAIVVAVTDVAAIQIIVADINKLNPQ